MVKRAGSDGKFAKGLLFENCANGRAPGGFDCASAALEWPCAFEGEGLEGRVARGGIYPLRSIGDAWYGNLEGGVPGR